MQCSFRYSRSGWEAIQRWYCDSLATSSLTADLYIFRRRGHQPHHCPAGLLLPLQCWFPHQEVTEGKCHGLVWDTLTALKVRQHQQPQLVSNNPNCRCSATSRAWFANNVLFAQPSRFSEYLLECPSPEVRQVLTGQFMMNVWTLGPASCLQADCVHSSLCSLRPSQPHPRLSV